MPEKQEHKFNENVENIINRIIVDDEYSMAKNANTASIAEFESIMDMLEGIRNEKEYSWMSDVCIPELASIILTDASGWASQDFQTRDFVEVKLDGEGENDDKKCKAAKKLINQTLNRKGLYHYQKHMRGRTINSIASQVYALCWWEQQIGQKKIGTRQVQNELDVDIYGNPITDRNTQAPAMQTVEEDEYGDDIKKDWFNYEIIDPRNVFSNNKYCYSIQQKDWIIIRGEKTYEELKRDEKRKGYFNLSIVKEFSKNPQGTDTSRETYDQFKQKPEGNKPVIRPMDHLLRLGKMWVVVKNSTEDGYPIDIEPGYDELGDILDNAELIETIIEEVVIGSTKVLIRFQVSPYRDSKGEHYKPLVRGLCYIHPTKDSGISDGKYLKETQKAINDNFNMMADRVKLATIPVLKGSKYKVGEDNPTIYFEPGHLMELEGDDPNAIMEFKIQDNIQGGLQIHSMLTNSDYQVTSVYPTTMGNLPEMASTTATAVAGAETRANIRQNYKALTYEFTYSVEFYWIIIQMSNQFMQEETALKMMGEYAEYFDPDADFNYSPLTQNVEREYSKMNKIRMIDQIIGRLVAYPNPKTSVLINKLLAKVFEYLGDEFPQYSKFLLDETVSPVAEGQGAGQGAGMPVGSNAGAGGGFMPTSNQSGNLQTIDETMTRGRMQ